jgi:hypothetical protein
MSATACISPEGTIENSPAFQRRVTCAEMTSPAGTADDRFGPNSSAAPSGLGPHGLLPGAKAPGYSRRVPPRQRGVKRPDHSHDVASGHTRPEGTNSPAFQRRVTCVGMTSPEGTADGRSGPINPAVPAGLDPHGFVPGAKAPGYSRLSLRDNPYSGLSTDH